MGNPPVRTRVMGDALVDLDEHLQPVWVWSAFDWLDVTRWPPVFRPPNPADNWRHCNGVVLAPDGNLLVSVRNQSGILKINYRGGSGDGSLLWTLGSGGTCQWSGGTNPDWFAVQHFPRIMAVNGDQITALGVFDNGNDRRARTRCTAAAPSSRSTKRS